MSAGSPITMRPWLLARRTIRRRSPGTTHPQQRVALVTLVCYLAGTIGLPAPGISAEASRSARSLPGTHCRCAAASVRAGTCCCTRTAAKKTCCAAPGGKRDRRDNVSEPGGVGRALRAPKESDKRQSAKCVASPPAPPQRPAGVRAEPGAPALVREPPGLPPPDRNADNAEPNVVRLPLSAFGFPLDGPSQSCCSRRGASQTKNEPNDRPEEPGLRVTSCPCGPGAPDGGLICADPRLPAEQTRLLAPAPTGARPRVESLIVECGTLEPQTPPPRV